MGPEFLFSPVFFGVFVLFLAVAILVLGRIAPRAFALFGWKRIVLGYFGAISSEAVYCFFLEGFEIKRAFAMFIVSNYYGLLWITLALLPFVLWLTARGLAITLRVFVMSIGWSLLFTIVLFIDGYERVPRLIDWLWTFVGIASFTGIIALAFCFSSQGGFKRGRAQSLLRRM